MTSQPAGPHDLEIVVITGLSGSGKTLAIRAFEDSGYFCVDNLPVSLIPVFADLIGRSRRNGARAALVVDVREGAFLNEFPAIFAELRRTLGRRARLLFFEADDETLIRRFSESRRPHPLAAGSSLEEGIRREREMLAPLKDLADLVIDSSGFNVHQMRRYLQEHFTAPTGGQALSINLVSFGYKYGVPAEADLVFDVRFLPNPHFIPEFRPYTGRNPRVAKYIRSFPQTQEFITRISDLLIYLLPHYIEEGKSYLTIGFGCTGGQHRSVLIAEEVYKQLAKAGYRVKVVHRDSPK